MAENSNEALLAPIHDEMKPHEIDPAHRDCRLCGATVEQLNDNLFPACSRRWEKVPTRFDPATWRRVPVEPGYVRGLEAAVGAFEKFVLDTLQSNPADADLAQIELAAYRNPMRDDGVFVAEKKEIEPYPGIRGMDGELRYPAVPRTPHKFPMQLPHEFARRVIACWNACRGHSTEVVEQLVLKDWRYL